MQGDDAPVDLVRALRAIARVPEIDVVIIGRGGGSAEDLQAFNSETVARAIAACPVPVISAVGHEVDFTIADFVADVRAATPSNAAELVVDRADNFRTRIDRASERLRQRAPQRGRPPPAARRRPGAAARHWPVRVALRDRDGQELAPPARARDARPHQPAARARRRLAAAARTARRPPLDRRPRARGWSRADGRLVELVGRRRLAAESRVRKLAAQLDALSPLAVLGRGYAVCWNETRTSIIRAAAAVSPGDGVRVTLADGELACRVVAADAAHDRLTEPEMPDSIKDFESAIAELERIVKQLEDGDLPLDKSLALFERGVELSRYCHDQLGAAQRRIEVLTERGELKDASHLLEPDDER